MKTACLLLISLALVGYASAECANACSGHGTCTTNDECWCFPNWMAADCSERVCPYGLSFVDTPRGDLNHDGVRSTGVAGDVDVMTSELDEYEVYNEDAVAEEGHFYTECSNKGLCDRETGLCECFAGYSGSSCQRTMCPNECSGHGVCRTVEEIAANGMNYKKTDSVASENFWTGIQRTASITYRLWDMDKSQGCVCDAGYSGPDCSRRECPRGDDPLTHRPADCGGSTCVDEVQQFTVVASGAAAVDWFYISFLEWTGETWRTDAFQFGDSAHSDCPASITTSDSTRAQILTDAITAIPNSVFEGITVSVTTASAGNLAVDFTFTHNSGNIAGLTWHNLERQQQVYGGSCAAAETTVDFTVTASSTTQGNKEESTCSNRGLCDYTTGLCKCFRGYYTDDCSQQNALSGLVSSQ